MQTSKHILVKTGILTSFGIGKKITEFDIEKLKKSLKDKDLSTEKFKELLKENIIKETQKSLIEQEIPGLIIADILKDEEEKKKFMELTYFSTLLSKKIIDKKLDKYIFVPHKEQ